MRVVLRVRARAKRLVRWRTRAGVVVLSCALATVPGIPAHAQASSSLSGPCFQSNVSPRLIRQVPGGADSPTVYFITPVPLDSGVYGNFAAGICGVSDSGSIKVVAPLTGLRSPDDQLPVQNYDEIDGLAVVPPGYPNSGTMYASSGAYGRFWAFGSDGHVLWHSIDPVYRSVVGIAPPDSAAPGGPLVLSDSATVDMLAADGTVLNKGKSVPGLSQLSSLGQSVAQAPEGVPGAGNLWFFGDVGNTSKALLAVAPTGELIARVNLPPSVRKWGNAGPLAIAPEGTPNAGTIFGFTVGGSRCYGFAVDPSGTRLKHWEYTRSVKGACSSFYSGNAVVGRAGSSNAGYVYLQGDRNGGGTVVVTPSGRVGRLAATVYARLPRGEVPSGRIWSTAGQGGGVALMLTSLGGRQAQMKLLTLSGPRAVAMART